MLTPADIFGSISAGRVLDVATGPGSFIHELKEGLKDYTSITGIDQTERAAAAFAANFPDDPAIRYEAMDALHMIYPDASFDTVCISNSLHHFDDPPAVLREMMRVLRPGGHFILSEMVSDGLSETQTTHKLLHHWWAAVDRANGVVHNETYSRDEMLAMLEPLHLSGLTCYDIIEEPQGDPHDPEVTAELESIFERYLPRVAGHPALIAQGEALRTRLREIGYHNANGLVVVALK